MSPSTRRPSLYLYEEDVYDPDCTGFGRRYRGLYKHFGCDTYDVDEEFYVPARCMSRGAGFARHRFYWDDE